MRQLFPRDLGSKVRYFHSCVSKLNQITNLSPPTVKQSKPYNVPSKDSVLIRRIRETAGNLKFEELIKIKDASIRRSIKNSIKNKTKVNHASTLDKISDTHLRNLLLNVNKELPRNRNLQSFLILELNSLLYVNKLCFKNCLTILIKDNEILYKALGNKIQSLGPNTTLQKSLKILIDYALLYNNTLLAGSLVLNNGQKQLEPPTIEKVLRALMMKNPVLEQYQLSLIIQICESTSYKLNEFEASQVLTKLESSDDISLIKKFQTYLLHNTIFNTQRSRISHYYKLIQSDAKLNNPAGCYLNWRYIMNAHDSIEKHDIRILALLIETFNKTDKYWNISGEIIQKLPVSYYSNALITSELLTYAYKVRDVELVNKITGEIKSTTRPTLTTLLRINMIFGDMNGVQSIIKEIISRSGRLSRNDNEIIVKGFLKNGKHRQALEFLGNIPAEAGNSSYLTYIDLMINCSTDLVEKQLLIIDRFVENMTHDLNDSFWGMLGSMYFKYVAKNAQTSDDLFLLKDIYTNSYKDHLRVAYMNQPRSKNEVISKQFTYNPFRVPKDERNQIIIKVSSHTKVALVYTILDKAIKLRSYALLEWACRELLDLGLTVDDIKVDVSKRMSSKLKSVGLEERKSTEQFRDSWNSNTLKIIKHRNAYKSGKDIMK